MENKFAGCHTIMWYDQYVENFYARGFKAYTPEAVLADLDTLNADIVALYAANQWGLAYYPSQVVPQAAGLANRDYFGEVSSGLHARGKKVIAYVNWLDSRHPEWRYRHLGAAGPDDLTRTPLQALPEYDSQGFGTVYKLKYGEWFNHCISSPHRAEMLQLVAEIAARYPSVDAIHMDMFFNYGICACDTCLPVLQEMVGGEVTAAAVLEHWDEYLTWRQEISTSLIAEMAAIAHKAGMAFAPNAFCPIYLPAAMAVSPGWWQHQDAYVTEAWLRLQASYADLHSTTIVSKWLRAIDKPSMLLVTGQHPTFSHAPLALEEYRLHEAGCLSNGAPIIGSCGQGAYPSTASSKVSLQTLHKVFGEYQNRMDQLPPRKSMARIAVMWSQDSRDFFEPGENSLSYRYEFLGYCRALLEGHYLFDVVVPEKLESLDDLTPYEFLVLPNAACMDKKTAELITLYVIQGGKLLATWETGGRDARGKRRSDPLLADVFGFQFKGLYPSSTVYAERLPEPCLVTGSTCVVEPGCANTILRFAAPDPDYPEEGSGVDLVPGEMTDNLFFTVNHFEGGQAWYVAGSLGYSAYKTGYYQMTGLLGEIFTSAGLPRVVEVEAPATVEVNLEQGEDGALYLHAANLSVPAYHPGKALDRSIDSFIPVHDIRVTFPGEISAASVISGAGQVALEKGEKKTTLALPVLTDYLLIKVIAGAAGSR